jgi:hypothetical protein
MVNKKQLENAKYFNYLGSTIMNNARCTCALKSRTAMAKAAFNKTFLFTSKLEMYLRKKLAKCYNWSIAVYGAKMWTVWNVDKK